MLIKTQTQRNDSIAEVLRESGIKPPGNNLREILDSQFLSLDDAIRQLSSIVHDSSDNSTKLRAIDTTLKLHKVLEEDKKEVPSITIVIQPPSGGHLEAIPSILIPRELNVRPN